MSLTLRLCSPLETAKGERASRHHRRGSTTREMCVRYEPTRKQELRGSVVKGLQPRPARERDVLACPHMEEVVVRCVSE